MNVFDVLKCSILQRGTVTVRTNLDMGSMVQNRALTDSEDSFLTTALSSSSLL